MGGLPVALKHSCRGVFTHTPLEAKYSNSFLLASCMSESTSGCFVMSSRYLPEHRPVTGALKLLPHLSPVAGGAPSLLTLSCDDTKLKTIPNEILTGCVKLCNLSMKGTRVDVNLMRNTPGYDAFDERRVKSRNKQIAGNVLVGGLDDVVGENQKR